MRSLLLILVLLAAALSGCADDEPADDHTPSTDDQSFDAGSGGDSMEGDEADSSNDEANDEGSSGVNTAPTASLEGSATSGEAPVDVTFDFDSVDSEGDPLTWELDVDGDGIAESSGTENNLPGNYTHTFTEAGSYDATFSVSDGSELAEAIVTVEVTEPAGADDGGEGEEENDGGDDGGSAEPVFEDRGWYLYDAATGMCHVKDFVDVGDLGLIYNAPLSGGDWYILEDNGVPGLQIENNHPSGPAASTGGFALDIPDCVDGDLVAV